MNYLKFFLLLFLLFCISINTILAQFQPIVKSNCSEIILDHSTNIFLKNGKPVSGSVMCNDTFYLYDSYKFEVLHSFRKFLNGKLIKYMSFHDNGNLYTDIDYDSLGKIKFPKIVYDSLGRMIEKVTQINKDILVENIYYSDTKKTISCYEMFFDSIYSPLIVKYDYENKMPLEITSRMNSGFGEGFSLSFDENDNYRLSNTLLFVAYSSNNARSVTFESSNIEYFQNGKIKKIVRNYEFPLMKEEIEFDFKGDLLKFDIYVNKKLIYHFK